MIVCPAVWSVACVLKELLWVKGVREARLYMLINISHASTDTGSLSAAAIWGPILRPVGKTLEGYY